MRRILSVGARGARRVVLAAVPLAHPAVASHGKPISLDELLLALVVIAMVALALWAFWYYPRFKRRRELRKRIKVVYEARRLARPGRDRAVRAGQRSVIGSSGESPQS